MPGIVILDMVLSYIPVRVHYRKAFSLAGSRRPSSDSIGPLSPPLAATRPGCDILENHPIAGCQVKVIAYLTSLYILYDLFIWNIDLRTSRALPCPCHHRPSTLRTLSSSVEAEILYYMSYMYILRCYMHYITYLHHMILMYAYI
jgi:hypothetical protein